MMVVNVGDKPLADFSKPLAMMEDCHRRIEHFLAVLRTLVAKFAGCELTDEGRRALQASLNYFANSGPRHTADEEQSLFPRMRSSESAEGRAVAAELDLLERDHRRGEACHASVDQLGRQWLETGRMNADQKNRLHAALDDLAAMYDAHIRLEEERVFVVASDLLNREQLEEIGQEMKRRRSLDG